MCGYPSGQGNLSHTLLIVQYHIGYCQGTNDALRRESSRQFRELALLLKHQSPFKCQIPQPDYVKFNLVFTREAASVSPLRCIDVETFRSSIQGRCATLQNVYALGIQSLHEDCFQALKLLYSLFRTLEAAFQHHPVAQRNNGAILVLCTAVRHPSQFFKNC